MAKTKAESGDAEMGDASPSLPASPAGGGSGGRASFRISDVSALFRKLSILSPRRTQSMGGGSSIFAGSVPASPTAARALFGVGGGREGPEGGGAVGGAAKPHPRAPSRFAAGNEGSQTAIDHIRETWNALMGG